MGLIYAHILLRPRPLDLSDGLAGHHSLINIVHQVAVVLRPGQQPLHRDEQLTVFDGVMVGRLLGPLESFLLDAVFTIYQSQQRRVHVRCWVLSPEVLTPIGQAHADLLP